MSCAAHRRLFGPGLDGRLSEPQQRALAAHLLRCPRCRQEHERWRSATALLRAAPLPAPPADLAERAYRGALAQSLLPARAALGLGSAFVLLGRRALLAGALALAAAWGGQLLFQRLDPAHTASAELERLAADPAEIAVTLWATEVLFDGE